MIGSVAFRALALAAALALPAQAMAQAAKPCLTAAEAEGLATFALPALIEGLSSQCAASLPATAPLVQSGKLIAAKYQPDADRAWPAAGAAFDKLSGMKMSAAMGQAGLRGLLNGALTAGIAKDMKPGTCTTVDRFVDILQPLPASNMARLVVAFLELGGQGKAGTNNNPLNICAPNRAAAAAK
jgi:hypothetical protein